MTTPTKPRTGRIFLIGAAVLLVLGFLRYVGYSPAQLASGTGKAAPASTQAPLYAERGWFGGCPTGYVDHPMDPKQCALPWVAERLLRPRR